MALRDVLEKMKLVEGPEGEEPSSAPPVHPPASSPAGTPRPPVAEALRRARMDEVLRSAPPRPKIDEAALGAMAKGDEVPDFPEIYRAAGVQDPPHGFSAYKVLEILSSPEFASLTMQAKAAALAGFLKMNPGGPVPIASIIQDAVARDQALDGFEDFLRGKLEARRAALDKENAQLQAETDEVTRRNKEKMDANRQAMEVEKQHLATWQTRKRIEEQKLFDAVAPFVEDNPVSVGGRKDAGRPGAPGGRPEGA